MQLLHSHLQLRLKSFNLLVKEFFKPVNMWQSSRQTGWLCHIPFAIYFRPWRCRTCQISKIWCLIVYYGQKVLLIVVMLIHRLIRVFIKNIKLLQTSFDLLTDWCHQWLTDCWSCTAFCCDIFFFVTAVVHSRSWDFLYGCCEYLFQWVNNSYVTSHHLTAIIQANLH